MRKIETYMYSGNTKSFKAGELTVGQYERITREPEVVLLELLTEFNEKVPDLTVDEMKEWSDNILSVVLRGQKKPVNPVNPPKLPDTEKTDEMKDFHISIGYLMHHLHQQYSEILSMPVRVFQDLLEDLPIIIGQKEYDPNRNSERIDGVAIRELKGAL